MKIFSRLFNVFIILCLSIQAAYSYGGEVISIWLTDVYILIIGIIAIRKKGVGWKYRIATLFNVAFSICVPVIIIDQLWPDLLMNSVLLALVYWLLLFPIFLTIYYFAEKKLMNGENHSFFYSLMRRLTSEEPRRRRK